MLLKSDLRMHVQVPPHGGQERGEIFGQIGQALNLVGAV